jgi:antitoxin MazE6
LTLWYNFSYTFKMKTAISIPDNVYKDADKLASRLGKSRSQLYTQAITNYLASHQREGITDKLNRLYTSQPSSLDKELVEMQTASLPKEDW